MKSAKAMYKALCDAGMQSEYAKQMVSKAIGDGECDDDLEKGGEGTASHLRAGLIAKGKDNVDDLVKGAIEAGLVEDDEFGAGDIDLSAIEAAANELAKGGSDPDLFEEYQLELDAVDGDLERAAALAESFAGACNIVIKGAHSNTESLRKGFGDVARGFVALAKAQSARQKTLDGRITTLEKSLTGRLDSIAVVLGAPAPPMTLTGAKPVDSPNEPGKEAGDRAAQNLAKSDKVLSLIKGKLAAKDATPNEKRQLANAYSELFSATGESVDEILSNHGLGHISAELV